MPDSLPLDTAVSKFGASVTAKASSPVVSGAPEDQLRGPLDALFVDLARVSGIPDGWITLIGETAIGDLLSRPDFAVTIRKALVGHIEVKAPGKGADPRRFRDPHDRKQFDRLKALPNLIYTDGNAFSLWRDGELQGSIVRLTGDVETSGAALAAPPALLALVSDFLRWKPEAPRNAKALADVSARLCRLLRDEVTEQMGAGSRALTSLAADWRKLLFPTADDAAFADGYAQAVTFGLLLARAQGIDISHGMDAASRELRKTNTLIGAALRLLTEAPEAEESLKTSLGTLIRVLAEVDWALVAKGDSDAWLYFYEEFLSVYDNALRKRTGSYYTPPPVVQAMVRLTDEALREPSRFGLPAGLAAPEVTVADPAVGTGTFLLGILRRIAERTEADYGAGAVPGVAADAIPRLIGFELQFGPYAVAQLRLLAEVAALTGSAAARDLRLFVTDTLGDPYAEEGWIPGILAPLADSRRQANAIKRTEPITVVIGNPPYKEKAMGRGGWIEAGSKTRAAPLEDWQPPREWGVGAHAKHLRNLYVYFWRWATWKVFGGVEDDPTRRDRKGVICFITVAGFLNGPGFEKMRADLRRDADEIFVVDCSPEGHQPEVATRIFQGVQQPVCIVMALRRTDAGTDDPARVRFRRLPDGRREVKFDGLGAIALDGPGWQDCPADWRAPFLPAAEGDWGAFVLLDDLFAYGGAGVMPGRTWVIAPDRQTLADRWEALRHERDPNRKAMLFHPHLVGGQPGDRHLHRPASAGLAGHEYRPAPVADDSREVIAPTRYAFRSFDRQWIIPDMRVLNRPNPRLWAMHGPRQIYLTALARISPAEGPAVTFAANVPDLDHFHGRGGRAFPLWADSGATTPNLAPALLAAMTDAHGAPVAPDDLFAWIAAIAAHPAYTARFAPHLIQPGLRIPITADPALFAEGVAIGREVIWLHTYGERFADPGAGRPAGPPRLPAGEGPTIPREGAIPTTPEAMPDELEYDPAARRLRVGAGFIDNVPPEVWGYEVSGKRVLTQWFSYRKRDRSRPIIGDRRPPSPLEDVRPDRWLSEYTTDLLDLLHVLGRLVRLEPAQADLLDRVCAGPLLHDADLRAAGAVGAAATAGGRARDGRQGELL